LELFSAVSGSVFVTHISENLSLYDPFETFKITEVWLSVNLLLSGLNINLIAFFIIFISQG